MKLAKQDLLRILGSTLPLASTDKFLDALRAVHLEYDGENLTATATDRYVLGRCQTKVEDSGEEPWTRLIDAGTVKTVVSILRKSATSPIVEIEDQGAFIAGYRIEEVAGEFPKVDSLLRVDDAVWTENPLAPEWMVDVSKISQFATAQKLAGPDKFALFRGRMNGSAPSFMVTIGDDFQGIVMGVRRGDES